MKITECQMKTDIVEVYNKIMVPPTKEQYKKIGKYGINTIVRFWGSWTKALKATIGVFNVDRSNQMPCIEKQCKNCNTQFVQKSNDQIFCSRSCSASYTNKSHPRRHKKTIKCHTCDNLISPYRQKFCSDCKKTGKHLRGGSYLKEKTIQEALYKYGANRYGTIRCHAHKVVKDRIKVCCNCGYDKHVEIHHIKDISNFPLDTKISIVNHPENLVLLCPNCHWECSNGLLDLNKIGAGGES